MADVNKIEQDIRDKAGEIAKELHKGKDIEIKTSNGGVKVLSVDKKIVK